MLCITEVENMIRLYAFLLIAVLTTVILLPDTPVVGETVNRKLNKLLREEMAPVADILPQERIYRRNDILYCSGDSFVATENNNAAVLMQSGSYREAIDVLEQALKKAPLFYPLLYNLGKSYAHLLDFRLAIHYLKKAQHIVPEYYLTYVEMGRTYETAGEVEEAIELYRNASHLDPNHLDIYVLLGNAYLSMNRRTQAQKYYNAVLDRDPYHSNGLLGKARLQFLDNKYYRAYQTLRIIDTERGEYDKAYHYYYAESAYNMQRYGEAYEQYEKLLEFQGDRFFLTTPIRVIEHKREMSRRFYEQEVLQRELQEGN